MAITKLSNTSNIVYNSKTTVSNLVDTIVLTAPTITKSVDKSVANIGDILTYTCIITNTAIAAINMVLFSDALPLGCTYKDNSFTVNGTATTPTITVNTLSYALTTLGASASATITFQVTVTGV